MQPIEFTSRSYIQSKKFALGTVLAAESAEEFETEFAVARAIAVIWLQDRKAMAGAIHLTVVVSRPSFQLLKDILEERLRGDDEQKIYGLLPLTVSFVDTDGVEIETSHQRGGIHSAQFRWVLTGRYPKA